MANTSAASVPSGRKHTAADIDKRFQLFRWWCRDGRLALRCPGGPHRGEEAESALVLEGDPGDCGPGVLFGPISPKRFPGALMKASDWSSSQSFGHRWRSPVRLPKAAAQVQRRRRPMQVNSARIDIPPLTDTELLTGRWQRCATIAESSARCEWRAQRPLRRLPTRSFSPRPGG